MSTRGIRRRLSAGAPSPLPSLALLLLTCASAEAQIATGSYVGNGAAGRSIPVSFRPDVVIVKVDYQYVDSLSVVKDVCSTAIIRTSTMAGDASKLMVGGPQPPADPDCPSPSTGFIPNHIQSLDANGFTVGNDLRVNGVAGACGGVDCTYHWVAFKANGDLRLGTYTGNGGGTQPITGLAFSPEYVMVLPNNNNRAHHRTPAGGTRSDRFGAGGATTLAITSLNADGFTVTADSAPNNVNAAGVTYHYVAWNAVAGSTAVGSYVGNGVDFRPIEQPGFQPRYVIVQSLTDSGGSDAIQRTASMTGDASVNFRGDLQINRIQALRPLGFEVGTYAGINNAAETYAFMAFGDGVADNPCSQGGSWWHATWGRRRRIVFNNSGQAEDLDNFPVLIKLDSSRIDYNKTQNAGQDLRFVDADNQTVLAHEIEVWNEAGTSYVWVKVPRINASSSSDFIYMYYDNAGAADGQSAAAVWSNGYRGVWHLKETPAGVAGEFKDSTSNANHGTGEVGPASFPTQTAGQIDGSLLFDGTLDRDVYVPHTASLSLPTELTVSGWARLDLPIDGQARLIVAKWKTASGNNFWLGKLDATQMAFGLDGGGPSTAFAPIGFVNDGAWHHVAGVAEAGGTMRIYVDGVQRGTSTFTPPIMTDTTEVRIGRSPDATLQDWDGGIDEVRVENVARSAAWIRAQHLSMADAFVTFHSEVGACQLRSIGSKGNSFYAAGTVSATQGSGLVTGSGTLWKDPAVNCGRGDRINIDGTDYTILTVMSDTQLRLASVFTGTNGSGLPYNISRKFTTLAAWENCVDGGVGECAPFPDVTSSLVTDNRSEVGIAYEDSPFNLSGDVVIDGSVTDATHTITLTADGINRHNGTPGAGVVVNANGAANQIRLRDSNVTLEWLELLGLRVANAAGLIHVMADLLADEVPQNVLLQNLLIHDFLEATPSHRQSGIRLSGDGGQSVTIRNTMVWDGDRSGIEANMPTDTVTIDNCSIDGMLDTTDGAAAGVWAADTLNVLVRNTIVTRTATQDYRVTLGTFSPSSTNNVSEDLAGPGGAPGLNAITGVMPDTVFLTPGVDLHLDPALTVGPTSPLNSGVDLSSAFLTDIDGQIRPAGAWDRGADERDPTTEVTLELFTAVGLDSAVDVQWKTASELRNVGFHVYRGPAAGGPWTRITSSLVPGLGSSPTGKAYSLVDAGLTNGVTYFYRLEDVDASGVSTFHGPVSATARAGASPPPVDPSPAPEDQGSQVSIRAWGDPSIVHFRILHRSHSQLLVELETRGFYTATDPASGLLRVTIPSFEEPSDPRGPALPLKRALIDGLVGRRARIASVRSLELLSFPGLVPQAQGFAEMAVSTDGTVRVRRRPAPLRASLQTQLPEAAASLVASAFLGETKKLVLELTPLRYDPAGQQLVLARRLRVLIVFDAREPRERGNGRIGRRAPRDEAPSAPSLLAFVHVSMPGLQGLPFEGVFPSGRRAIPLGSLKLSRQGRAVPFHVEPQGGSFGPGGMLFFHAAQSAAATAFTGQQSYSLSLAADGVRMAEIDASPAGAPASASLAVASFEANRTYQPGLLEASDPWLWEPLLAGAPKTIGFALEAVEATSALPARLSLALQGASDVEAVSDHHVRAYVNGAFVGETRFDGKRPATLEAELGASLLREGENQITLENTGESGVASLVFLDRISLVHPQLPRARGGRFDGTWTASGLGEISGFASSPSGVVEIAGAEPRWLSGASWTGSSLRFSASEGRRYLLASAEGIARPRVSLPAPASFSDATQADYVLIAPRAFLEPAERLLERRRSQGLSTLAVSLEEIAEGFGEGDASAEAIRSFLSHAFHRFSSPSPRYVVLLGGSTYDPRNFTGRSRPSPLPAFMVKTSYLVTVSDPMLAAVNGEDGLPDLAIGRLPASTLEEANTLVDKLLAWEDTVRSLDGRAVLVADNPDVAGDFEANQSDIEASFLAGRDTERLFLRELGSQMRPAILHAFDEGASLMSYVGHGGAAVWASENVLNSWDASALLPQSLQPVLLTLNCLNGYFVSPTYDSLAEAFLKAQGRGTVAGFSPSGLSLDGPAHRYHRALMAELVSGRHERLGDAILSAQRDYAETGAMPELLSIYHLLGDPAMPIR